MTLREVPFVVKLSGTNSKAGGPDYLLNFVEAKAVGLAPSATGTGGAGRGFRLGLGTRCLRPTRAGSGPTPRLVVTPILGRQPETLGAR